MGAGRGALEPVFQKQLLCKDNRCALSLLTSVHGNSAEDAVGLLVSRSCFWLLPTKTLGGFFSRAAPWLSSASCTTPRALPSCAENCCPAEFLKVPFSLLPNLSRSLNSNPAIYLDWSPPPLFICKPNAINLYSKMFTEALQMTPHPQQIPLHVGRAVVVHKSAA